MTKNHIIEELKILLEDFNPLEDEYGLDIELESLSSVSEAKVPKSMKQGDIRYCDFNYDNITRGLDTRNPKREKKDRRCLVIRDKDFGDLVMRLSSVKDEKNGKTLSEQDKQRIYNGKYTHILLNSSLYNFSKRTYAEITDVRKVKDLKYIEDPVSNGKPLICMDSIDLKPILSKFKIFKATRYEKIELFRSYLKLAKFSYSPHGKIQTITDIDSSNRVTNIDITSICMSIVKRHRIPYKILWTKLDRNGKIYHHFTCVYRNRDKSYIGSFRYFAQLEGKAEIHIYKNTTDFDKIINAETNWILQYYPNHMINANSRYLTPNEIKIWMRTVSNADDSDDLIKQLEQFNTVLVDKPFNPYESVNLNSIIDIGSR